MIILESNYHTVHPNNVWLIKPGHRRMKMFHPIMRRIYTNISVQMIFKPWTCGSLLGSCLCLKELTSIKGWHWSETMRTIVASCNTVLLFISGAHVADIWMTLELCSGVCSCIAKQSGVFGFSAWMAIWWNQLCNAFIIHQRRTLVGVKQSPGDAHFSSEGILSGVL